jgi:NAD+ kinase
MTMGAPTVLLVVNVRSSDARSAALSLISQFAALNVDVRLVANEALELGQSASSDVTGFAVVEPGPTASAGCDVVVVLGGDGTILRAAEWARDAATPLLGVNLGHVGFLAESEEEDMASVVSAIVNRSWQVEERLALEISIFFDDGSTASTWALNEVSVEKDARQRMIQVLVEVDGRPLSTWGCDGVVCASPTGSTAYAFSAGGPVVWPEVSAMLVVPLSAHALFARPMVISPHSVVALDVAAESPAVVWADGRRSFEVPQGARIEVRASAQPVHFARVVTAPFTDRLVAKFELPVAGWRGRRSES